MSEDADQLRQLIKVCEHVGRSIEIAIELAAYETLTIFVPLRSNARFANDTGTDDGGAPPGFGRLRSADCTDWISSNNDNYQAPTVVVPLVVGNECVLQDVAHSDLYARVGRVDDQGSLAAIGWPVEPSPSEDEEDEEDPPINPKRRQSIAKLLITIQALAIELTNNRPGLMHGGKPNALAISNNISVHLKEGTEAARGAGTLAKTIGEALKFSGQTQDVPKTYL